MQGNRHLVLVVEDRRKWRDILAETLNRSYDVAMAKTKDAGIEQVRQREFDAVILNPNLVTDDDFLGVDVLDAVVRHRPLMPCILLAGTPELQASQMGRYGYQIYALLTKGGIKTLLATLENAIRDRATVRELLSILDADLSHLECGRVILDLARYYTHLRFQAPPNYTDNTKRQKFAYMISVLVSKVAPEDVPGAIRILCDIVRGLKPHDHDLWGKLDGICQVNGGHLPLPLLPSLPPDPHVAAIRDLMTAAFSVQTLKSFCQDRPDFQPLHFRFSPADGLVDMVARVIDYCMQFALLEKLLDEIRDANPSQYARFAPSLHGPTP